MAYIDDVTNQTKCECLAIYDIHVVALVFMCVSWVIISVKNLWIQTWH